MKQVKDKKNLFRDENSHAIINTDRQAYNAYIKLKKQKLEEKEELDSFKKDLDCMKNEIGEIKSLIKQLINGNL
tara:strand:- start:4002 stop:4223 length:222 start_codon:yes stop_codon:yes gene_type:complete